MRAGLHTTSSRSGDPVADGLLEGYVAWREASEEVWVAYRGWVRSERRDRQLAHAAYVAALDREQHAACFYERLIEDVAPRQR
jgi:hypothetical protein